jgi:DNA-binding NtrC family response regulator
MENPRGNFDIMEEEKNLLNQVASEDYVAAYRPFDFVGEGAATALVCESDPAIREKISTAMEALGYRITAPERARDVLKSMRFHIFDLVIVNELFDTTDPRANDVLHYLESMAMTTRRRFFVALVSGTCRTMDNMAAFNRSVNIVINLKNIDEVGKIIKQGVAENRAFYHIFNETLQKTGKA